ncbi:transketolase, partial [Vibrio sp. 10N.222.46.A1]
GWHVIADVDGHNADDIHKAITEAKAVTDKPTLICCKTVIGFGSPNKSASHDCHGAPLGADEVALVRLNLGWDHPEFEIPQDVYQAWDGKEKGQSNEDDWQTRFNAYQE